MPGEPVIDVPPDLQTDAPTGRPDLARPEVRTSVDLDASIDEVLDALRDPELLSAWLGPWTEHHVDGSATVRTDDGRHRRVTDRRWSAEGVQWRWQDAASNGGSGHELEGASVERVESEVTIRLTEVDGRTRLTVHEAQLHAGPHAGVGGGHLRGSIVLESATWLAGLLALGAVLAASSLVRV